MERKLYKCKDCALGEIKPCFYEGFEEYEDDKDSTPLSCPLGKCGEDVVWKEIPFRRLQKIPSYTEVSSEVALWVMRRDEYPQPSEITKFVYDLLTKDQ